MDRKPASQPSYMPDGYHHQSPPLLGKDQATPLYQEQDYYNK